MASVADTRTSLPVVRRDRWGVASYLFMRLSGLALAILVLVHFGIQHVLNDVHNLNIDFVAARWATLGWRIYDAFLLALGLIHGLNGTRIVINDYILNPTLNRIVKTLVLLIGVGLIIIGSVAIIGGVRVM